MNKSISISKLLFYIAYIGWVTIKVLNFTFYRDIDILQKIFDVLYMIIYIMLIFKILYDNKYSINTIKWVILCGLVFIISINSNSKILLEVMIFIYAARNIRFRDIVKVSLILHCVLMGFIILSSMLGIIKNDIWIRDNGLIRYGLGYTYCTFSSNFYYHIVLMYVFLKDKIDFKIIDTSIILIINQIFYILTDTKAVYYLIILLMILLWYIKFNKNIIRVNIMNKLVFKYCFVISALISIVSSIYYNSSNIVYVILNKIFTDRLVLGNIVYKEYGIPLFGQNVQWITGRAGIDRASDSVYRFVDSSYLNIAINFGIIILILICIGFTIICKKALEDNKKSICIALLFLAIHSISDPQLLQPQYHPFLLIFSMFFSSNKLNYLRR